MLDQSEKPLKVATPKRVKRVQKQVGRTVDAALRSIDCWLSQRFFPPFEVTDEHKEATKAVRCEFVCQAVWHLVLTRGHQGAVAFLERLIKDLREGHEAFFVDPLTGETTRKEALMVLRHGGRGSNPQQEQKI